VNVDKNSIRRIQGKGFVLGGKPFRRKNQEKKERRYQGIELYWIA